MLALLSLTLLAAPVARLEPVAEGLTAPVALAVAPGEPDRLYVAQQTGQVRVIEKGRLLPQPFLDVSSRMVQLSAAYDERGLLGLTFHPQYASNGRLFAFYSAPLRPGAPAGWDNTGTLVELHAAGGKVDPQSLRVLLEVDHPQGNHDGCTLAFGSDGKLYLSIGDGGARADVGRGHVPGGNAQDPRMLLGKILRIDVDRVPSGKTYGIPVDNPFAEGGGAPEVWAYGLRNAFRFSFDRGTGRLFAGDVGQDLVEEVDIVERGGNYGWNVREGPLCFDPDDSKNPPATCPDVGRRGEPLRPPIVAYLHPGTARRLGSGAHGLAELGIAVIGGYVYRGSAIPRLAGTYVFGDWQLGQGSGVLLTASEQGGSWKLDRLALVDHPDGQVGAYVTSLGQGADGELYVLTTTASGPTGTSGKVFRLAAAP